MTIAKRKAAAPLERRDFFFCLEFGLNEMIGLEEKGKEGEEEGVGGGQRVREGRETSKSANCTRTTDGNEGDAEKPASGKLTVTSKAIRTLLIGRARPRTPTVRCGGIKYRGSCWG